MQISSQSQRRVPSVWNEANAIVLGHPSNLALFADPADFGHIWLHDIESARFNPWLEGLPTRKYLTTRDRQWGGAAQRNIART